MKVFISYAHGDRSFAYTLPVVLAGDEVLIDSTINGDMRAAIAACDSFIAVLSPRYVESAACAAEWQYALALGKPIRLLMLEASDAPPELRHIEPVDIRDRWRSYLGEMRAAIRDESEKETAHKRVVPSPESLAAEADASAAAFARSLLAWDLERCAALSDLPDLDRLPDERRRLFVAGAAAIRDRAWGSVLPLLDDLARLPVLSAPERAALYVLAGRVHLDASAAANALRDFERAAALAPDSPDVLAGFGEYYHVVGDAERAEEHYRRAISAAPAHPGALIGLGLLAEEAGDWHRADAYYAEAIAAIETAEPEADLLQAVGRLLVPARGNLYLQVARALRRDRPAAGLHAVDEALAKGVRDGTDYPERLAYRVRGELLEALGQPAEAASAFYEAGIRFNWLNQHVLAADMLESAYRLKPHDALICWYLANSLLMTSYIQEHPYVREEPLRRSMAVWEQGLALQTPAASESWIYTLRALQLEQAANLPGADQQALWWEAAAYLERAIALREDEANRWHILNRCHRSLLNEATAMHAARLSVEHAPEDPTILSDAIITLTNAAQFAEVEPLLEALNRVSPSPWVDAVSAFIRLRLRRPEEAMPLIERVFEQVPEAERQPWYYEMRADAHRALNQPERAREDYRWLWDQRDQPTLANSPGTLGWAAFSLGLFDEAARYLQRALDEGKDLPASLLIQLGLCRFALGDVPAGEAAIEQGVAHMRNGLQVGQFLDFDLHDGLRLAEGAPQGQAMRAILLRARDEVIRRRPEIEQPTPPTAELEARRAGDLSGWAAVAVTAGLARLYAAAGRWQDAATLYRELLGEGERFPEAGARLRDVVDEFLSEGDDQLRAGEYDAALETYEAALSDFPDDTAFQADLRARIGCAQLAHGEDAQPAFREALRLFAGTQTADPAPPGRALGERCAAIVPDTAFYWELDAAWEAMAAGSHDGAALEAARVALSGYLTRAFGLAPHADEPPPVVLPIIVEIAADLVPEDTSTAWPLFGTYIPDMRERIARDTGVTVPGVRIRGNDGDLAPGSYVLMLDEVPLTLNVVYPGLVFCRAAAESLAALDITPQRESIDPFTLGPGGWIAPEDAPRARAAGIETWDDPLRYVAAHLELLLRTNLIMFLGLQEVEFLLETWRAGRLLVPDAASRLRFGRVLRALLREGVPINRPADILAAIEQVGLADDDIFPVLRAARLRMKDLLPVHLPRIPLPVEVEASIASGITRVGDKVFLALAPDPVREALAALRERLAERGAERGAGQALIVSSGEVRPFVRALAEVEFPLLTVLSQEELPDA